MEFKIVLVGDSGVGKTSFIKRHRNGSFDGKYIATQGVDVVPLTFNTNYGLITFKIWDCAGQEKFGGLRDGYYYNADGAIVMFDLGSRVTFNNINKWVSHVKNIVPDCSFVICGNKSDLPDKEVDITNIIILDDNMKLYCVSAKTSFRYEMPFLHLAKKLTNHDDLEFVEITPTKSSEVKPSTKKTSLITNPNGGIIRITYEFFEDGEIIDQ